MKPLTFRVEEETHETLKQEASNEDLSVAEYLRSIVEKRNENETIRDEYEAKLTEYESKLEEYETKLDRLEREKLLILEDREEKQELVEYVEEERSLSRQKAEAGIATRAKWWLFGMES